MSLIISPPPTDPSQRQFGTITRVQSISGNTGNANGTATSLTLTFGANLTVGNVVIVALDMNSNAVPKILDPGGTQLALAASSNNTNGTITGTIGYLLVETAGTSIVISASSTAAFNGAAVGVEYSGVKLRPEGMPIGSTAAIQTVTTGSLTTGQPNELLVAAVGYRGTFASEQTSWLGSITNSFSSVLQSSSFNNVASADRAVAFLERIVSSSGTYSTGGTAGIAGNQYSTLIGSFVSD